MASPNVWGYHGGTTGVPLAAPASADPLSPRNRPGHTYQPKEQAIADIVNQALAMGLDPSIASQVLGNIQSQAQTRWQNQAQNRQELTNTIGSGLLSIAQQNENPGAGAAYLEGMQALHPNLPGSVADRLAEMQQQIYPGHGASPLYIGDPNNPSNPVLDKEDFDALSTEVGAAVDKGYSLSAVRGPLVQQYRDMHYSDEDIQAVYDYIGKAYTARGGNPGQTPVYWEDRLAQQQNPRPTPGGPTGPVQPVMSSGGIGAFANPAGPVATGEFTGPDAATVARQQGFTLMVSPSGAGYYVKDGRAYSWNVHRNMMEYQPHVNAATLSPA